MTLAWPAHGSPTEETRGSQVQQLPQGERKVPVKVVEQRATNFLIHAPFPARSVGAGGGEVDHHEMVQKPDPAWYCRGRLGRWPLGGLSEWNVGTTM